MKRNFDDHLPSFERVKDVLPGDYFLELWLLICGCLSEFGTREDDVESFVIFKAIFFAIVVYFVGVGADLMVKFGEGEPHIEHFFDDLEVGEGVFINFIDYGS